MTGKAYDVKDPALADQGRLRIDWAFQEMPVRRSLMDRFRTERPLTGIRRRAVAVHASRACPWPQCTASAAG